jgi:hypothetical protein
MGRPLGRSQSTAAQKAQLTASDAPRFVRGYVTVVRRGVEERMTFTTIDGLRKIVEEITKEAA